VRRIALFVCATALAATCRGEVPRTDGEVQRIDPRAQEITIKHGPIPHLNMPAMTMPFAVKDPMMLRQVKAGDKVKFTAENIDNQAVITNIEVTR
jgi:Cu(I)/Ag(I) efflux system periplasmic protein CusF